MCPVDDMGSGTGGGRGTTAPIRPRRRTRRAADAAAEALRESEERFRRATQILAGFLYDWNPSTNEVEWFGGTEEVMGFSLDEVAPDVAWYEARVHPDDLPGARQNALLALECGAAGYSHVYRFLHRDGRYVHVLDRSQILRDADGRPIRVLGAVTDVSERVRFEEEREALLASERKARTAAEGAAMARDEVLNVVSHDLGAPLSAIALCASALEHTEAPTPENIREITSAIHRSTDWIHRLIKDLVDVSSIQSGGLKVQLRAETPAAIIEATAAIMGPEVRDKGVLLETRVSPRLPRVLGDADRLQQALTNLLKNALAFTDPGGRITLLAELNDDAVCFSVEDTGTGIVAEDLPHIFERYWSRERVSEGGRGLGLAIVKGIVEVHGGRVNVESTPGRGSRFSFAIPLAETRV